MGLLTMILDRLAPERKLLRGTLPSEDAANRAFAARDAEVAATRRHVNEIKRETAGFHDVMGRLVRRDNDEDRR